MKHRSMFVSIPVVFGHFSSERTLLFLAWPLTINTLPLAASPPSSQCRGTGSALPTNCSGEDFPPSFAGKNQGFEETIPIPETYHPLKHKPESKLRSWSPLITIYDWKTILSAYNTHHAGILWVHPGIQSNSNHQSWGLSNPSIFFFSWWVWLKMGIPVYRNFHCHFNK